VQFRGSDFRLRQSCRSALQALRRCGLRGTQDVAMLYGVVALEIARGTGLKGRNNLLLFVPRAANFIRPVLIVSPAVEIVGDRSVTAADLSRVLRHGGCWFDRPHFDAWWSAVHLRNSSRSLAVAHLTCLADVHDTGCRALSSTRTVPQAGSHRRQARANIAMGISQRVAVS
jgi:hypothetical protein